MFTGGKKQTPNAQRPTPDFGFQRSMLLRASDFGIGRSALGVRRLLSLKFNPLAVDYRVFIAFS
jgi:hypothetical protein